MPQNNRLTHQVVNSQAVSRGNAQEVNRPLSKHRDTLKRAGLCDEKGDIETSEWIECLKAEETSAVIERNLKLKPGSFREKKKKEKERN